MTKNVFTALDQLVAPARTSDGIRWYSAPSVLKALKLDVHALAELPHHDKTLGDDLPNTLISEPAFLRLALNANVETAAALRKWLCLTVLPAIWVSNSYFLHEELAIRARVPGVLELPEWQLEQATRHILPLLRKNSFYFAGMEDVALGLASTDDFQEAQNAAFARKRVELEALGFELP